MTELVLSVCVFVQLPYRQSGSKPTDSSVLLCLISLSGSCKIYQRRRHKLLQTKTLKAQGFMTECAACFTVVVADQLPRLRHDGRVGQLAVVKLTARHTMRPALCASTAQVS